MTQKKLIFTAISLSTLFSIIFLTFHQSYSNENPKIKKDLLAEFEANTYDLRPRNELWEQMNEYVFFKRSSAYYIIEKSLLKVYFISKTDINQTIDMIIKAEFSNTNSSSSLLIHNVEYTMKETRSNYNLNLLYYKFDMLNTFGFTNYDEILKNLSLKLYFKVANSFIYKTQYPIHVKIKYIQLSGQKKSGSIICSKCYFFNKDDYQFLLWWIEFNKQIGYKKLVFCNQSIPNTPEFNQIFSTYKDFIELKQFRSFPNFNDLKWRLLSHNKHDYLTEYYDLSPDKQYDNWYLDGYDVMHTNECFLENADKYEYVTVVDNDETVVPRINTRFRTKNDAFKYVSKLDSNYYSSNKDSLLKEINSISLTCQHEVKSKIESYLHSYNENTNFNFGMAYYLRDVDVKKIFNSFDAYFSSSYFDSKSFEHTINVIDTESENKFHNPYNFTFVIRSFEELTYAKNLLFLYRNFLEKFDTQHRKTLSVYTEQFRRYFYISGTATDWLCGKSIWHTDKTSEYSVHYGVVAEELYYMNFDQGHNGHFRRNYPFKPNNISISELSLDFNYLNCFYKPIIQKFANISIF